MPFVQHLCWTPEPVDTVMKTDAENAADAIFLAVHSRHPLKLMDTVVQNRRVGDDAPRISADEFLKLFMAPNRHHMQVVIQGDSGSGKSHLIKWMALNTPRSEKREVLVIPRAGMSLRSIVQKVISILPTELREYYLNKLKQAANQAATPEQRRDLLMNNIAMAILSDPHRDRADDEGYLIEQLPVVFHDPPLRGIFSRKDGVMDKLLAHIYENSKEYERLEHQRLFREEDLPLHPSEFKDLSAPARKVITQLRTSPEMVDLALTIINRNLERAIPSVLQFTGDELSDLMLEIRRSLRDAGKELVLLIEDFATLQGIDRAILAQLILASSQENGLCDLRWAMAATHGYYDQVANTVQTRMDYLVDMDLPTGANGLSQEQIVAFAARYLNATRLNEAVLERWRTEELAADSGAPVPNACMTCSFRETCHREFGEKNGFGLYPFTEDAIMNMAARTNAHLEQKFNPRNLIRNVLREVLEEGGRYIDGGRFPSAQLLERMHGGKLPAVDEVELKRQNPEHFSRLNALQGLWSRNPREYQVLPEGIYTAFGLKPVHLKSKSPARKPVDTTNSGDDHGSDTVKVGGDGSRKTEVVKPRVEVKPQRSTLDDQIEAIEAWGKGGIMPQNLDQALRDLIFPALVTYLDWDRAGLAQTAFAEKGNGLFRNTSIIFKDRATTNPFLTPVTLPVPLVTDGRNESDERLQSAIALMGLLRFNAQGNWDFSGGIQSMVAVAEALDRWSAHVLTGFREMLHGHQDYNPVPAAIEVLAAGAALAGKLGDGGQPLSSQVNALFVSWPAPETLPHQTENWQKLYKDIHPLQDGLRQMVKVWAGGTKGMRVGSYLDLSQVIPALQAMQQNGVPVVPLPDGVAKVRGYEALAVSHKRLRNSLPGVAQGEWAYRVGWLKKARHQVPEGTPWAEVVTTLSGLLTAVRSQGIACEPKVEQAFAEALQAASGVGFDSLVTELQALAHDMEPVHAMPLLSRNETGKMMTVIGRFLDAAERFLIEVEAGVENGLKGLEAETLTLRKDQGRIRESLAQLADSLGKLGGNHAS